jgi:deoxyribodipyrimidine photo-lyase
VLPTDIREARTGVLAIDEAVRTLYSTGTLHNHARMWLASYVVHLRHVHWRAGADWLVAHLLDGDLASDHLSWQWVAGTGGHKLYLFNADNVARYAPAHWHSAGSVIDQAYEAPDRIARSAHTATAAASPGVADTAARPEPPVLTAPPASLGLRVPDAAAIERLRGHEVWLVHPWALRAPPADLPHSFVVIGLYLHEHHEAWPWPEARWRWVDTAMAALAPERWTVDAAGLVPVRAAALRQLLAVVDPRHARTAAR